MINFASGWVHPHCTEKPSWDKQETNQWKPISRSKQFRKLIIKNSTESKTNIGNTMRYRQTPSVSAIARASFDSSSDPPVTYNDKRNPNYSSKKQIKHEITKYWIKMRPVSSRKFHLRQQFDSMEFFLPFFWKRKEP